ncbi:MAG: nuclear transport factor 2 family protein [Cyanobacteria bacterium SIG30]|nr:nuclear transport factor 2 family protein [Cyanobacteria bacterium SIG30]
MKKYIILLLIQFIFLLNVADAKSVFFNCDLSSVKNSFNLSDFKTKNEVRNFLHNLNKKANEHDIEALKTMYDKEYKSMDGFGYEDFFKMIKETFESYPDIKYATNIKDIAVFDNKAIARLSDSAKANLKTDLLGEEFDNKGVLYSKSDYVVYLKKDFDNNWKVLYDFVEYEESSLRYGEAINLDAKFDAPLVVKPNKDYTLSLNITPPKDTFILSSLNNEEIIYPSVHAKESFRKIINGIPLERIVRSNKKGHNEYAVASIGLTRLSVNNDKVPTTISFGIKMSGMAFMMRRVNVLNQKENVFEGTK